MTKRGRVSLVGAGPGDRRLLTLGGKQSLEEADVVIFDRLISEQILDFAAEGVEKIYVGKSTGQHTLTQDEINQLIVEKAKEGKYVVRLKGGDPFVFGRGGEEAIACLENKISFDIIPGVTSAVAVPAYAGIPVTHRHFASSFTVITGHEDSSKMGSIHRWKHLAHGSDTLVFLMGVENLSQIQEQLLAAGKELNTPVAFVQWGTYSKQKTWITTLEKAIQTRDENQIKAPAVVLVGKVVNLQDQLAWFEKKPLFGKTVLVTRAREQASELSRLLEEAGAWVIETPMIQLVPPKSWEPVDQAIEGLEDYQWIVFTSANGVKHFMKRLFDHQKDVRCFSRNKIAVIGTSTEKMLKKYGIQADLVAKEFQAEGLLESLRHEIQAKDRVLIVRPEEARNVLPEGLAARGADVTIAPVYQTARVYENQKEVQELLKAGKVDWITFGSASTVRILMEVVGDSAKEALQAVKVAAIGPLTKAEVEKHGILVTITPSVHTVASMVEEMIQMEENLKDA